MPKFSVSGEVTISVHTDVEAETEEEAKKIAADRGTQSFCYQCARGEPEQEWTTTGDIDGEITITGVYAEE